MTEHQNYQRSHDRRTASKNKSDTHLCIPIRWCAPPPAAAVGRPSC